MKSYSSNEKISKVIIRHLKVTPGFVYDFGKDYLSQYKRMCFEFLW